jgi:hypothetical protein
MQGHSDDEEEEEAVAPAEMLQEVVPIQQDVADAPPPPPPPPAQQPRPVDWIMQLSVQALHGMPGEGTFSRNDDSRETGHGANRYWKH